MLGREGSVAFPGKNTAPVLGRPLMAYPLLAAKAAPHVERIYVSTDSAAIRAIAAAHGARSIERPAELCTAKALGEDAYLHGYRVIREELGREGRELEFLLCLFCNAPNLLPRYIDEAVGALRARPELDSAITVSKYNMWSPLRARRIGPDGLLEPFVPFETFGDPKTLNCDRDSQGDVWFADFGLVLARPSCFEDMGSGQLPQKWMGRRIHPIKQWGGLDVDEAWQLPQVELWLRAQGFTETALPYESAPGKSRLAA